MPLKKMACAFAVMPCSGVADMLCCSRLCTLIALPLPTRDNDDDAARKALSAALCRHAGHLFRSLLRTMLVDICYAIYAMRADVAAARAMMPATRAAARHHARHVCHLADAAPPLYGCRVIAFDMRFIHAYLLMRAPCHHAI